MSRLKVLIAAIALGAAACGSDNTPVAPTPAPSEVDTFAGTLNPNGAQTHSFTVTRSGSLNATITALAPDGSTVGVALGTWDGTNCQLWLTNDNAVVNASLTGIASSAGSLCVRVYDVGKVADSVAYEVRVLHY